MQRQRLEIEAADREWMEHLGWGRVDEVLACTSHDVAAMSQSSDVVRVPIDPALGGPTTVFIKRYLYQRGGQRLKQMFRGTLIGKSRARREYEFLREMRRRQVPTVRPIAYGEQRRGAFLWASFVITEGLEGVRSLDRFAQDHIRRHSMRLKDYKTLIAELAATIRKMHDAGVRHGGLYWRNILVQTQPDGRCRFGLVDPDGHGRMFPAPVPEVDAVADLSEMVSSAMALGLRGGLLTLMKAYFQVPKLSAAQRHLIQRILERARKLAPAEQRRMAVTESIEWLRDRIARKRQESGGTCTINTLDEFFDVITSAKVDPRSLPHSKRTIRFSFSGVHGGDDAIERCVIMENGRLTVGPKGGAEADLLIRSDPETWLAVISGRPDAFARVRDGRLRMDGDSRLLPLLMGPIDGEWNTPSSKATDGPQPSQHDGSSADAGGMTAADQPVARAFGRKYKADEFARYYARKHQSSLPRRISNFFERTMVRRALARIRHRKPFHTVLDCPSGTGRFLPTLAGLNVSVIAMDTSQTMLREGRRHYTLFQNPPVAAAASAFRLPLPDRAVDVVLCARLLHHIPDRQARVTILREFARVARVGVVISFFDSASFRAWKRRRKTRRTGRPSGRHAITREQCAEDARAAGLKPLGMNALLRYHTEVTAASFLLDS